MSFSNSTFEQYLHTVNCMTSHVRRHAASHSNSFRSRDMALPCCHGFFNIRRRSRRSKNLSRAHFLTINWSIQVLLVTCVYL